MPYPTPNLTTLQQGALSDIQSADITDLSGNAVTGLLQKSILRVVALVQAGMAYLQFRFLDYIAKQCTPFTATGEWLAGWMSLKGITRIAASAATGSATFTTSGPNILAGTIVNRGDGFSFTVTANGTITSTTVTVQLQANSTGSGGTIIPGTSCALGSPIGGVNGNGTFTASTTAGTDQETDDSLRSRGLAAYRTPAQGGSVGDYIGWALQVPGVTRAWCPPSTAGAGTVQVYFMEDVVRASEGGIPQGSNGGASLEGRTTPATGDQLAVANYIFFLRPVTALVIAMAPTPSEVEYTIANLSPNNATTQAGVTAALQDMHTRVATPGGTARPDGLTGGEIYESDWTGAIRSVPGVLAFDVTSPTGTLTSAAGVIPTFGGATFT